MNYTIIAKGIKTVDEKTSVFGSKVFSISVPNQITGTELKAEINKIFPNPAAPVIITSDALLEGTTPIGATSIASGKVIFYNVSVTDAPGASASKNS